MEVSLVDVLRLAGEMSAAAVTARKGACPTQAGVSVLQQWRSLSDGGRLWVQGGPGAGSGAGEGDDGGDDAVGGAGSGR